MGRPKYKLALKRRKKRAFVMKPSRLSMWPSTIDEVFNKYEKGTKSTPKGIKRPVVRTFSTSKKETTSGKKVNTPSKSPCPKKVKRSLKRSLFSETDLRFNNNTVERDNNVLNKIDKSENIPVTFSTNLLNDTDEFIELDNVKESFETESDLNFGDVVDTNDNDALACENEITSNEHTCRESEYLQDRIQEMIRLVPSVLDKLSLSGNDKHLLDFFKQVHSEKFPLENIAFVLWIEVVKWYQCQHTTLMRYSDLTKKFWKLGYRTFGGQFIHFMSGFKNNDSVVLGDAERGMFNPNLSNINFAVPDVKVIRNFSPYDLPVEQGSCRKPGIFTDMISCMAKAMSGKSCCMTFDGKKIKRGLTENGGDVDILGFEKGDSIATKQEAHNKLLQPISNLNDMLLELDDSENIVNISVELKNELQSVLRSSMKDVSRQILDMHQVKKKKEYAKEKLIERSGEGDWKNGKYVMAISSIIAFLHDIDRFNDQGMDVIKEVMKCLVCLNNSQYIENDTLNVFESDIYKEIKVTSEKIPVISTREVKQRTDMWFNERRKAKITGSTFYKAIGLEGLQKQKEHFDTVMCGLPEKPHSDKTKEALQYGTVNEINATATFVGRVMPLLFPGQTCFEEGYVGIGHLENSQFLIVSPDGSVRESTTERSSSAGIELKCPLFEVHKQLPARYLLQCLSEIEALDVSSLIFLSWRPDISTVFKVKRNTELFEKAFNVAKELYGAEKPKRPSKLSEQTKVLKGDIEQGCLSEETVEFIGLIPSMKHESDAINTCSDTQFRVCRARLLLNLLIESLELYHNLKREPATEAVVFLCCDLDRQWDKDSIRCAPVCWFPKGYSLDTDTLRSLLETLLDICCKRGLHIPAMSFDGQWHNIAVRDTEDSPLTLLQLQKGVWKKVEQMAKSDILKEIKELNKNIKWTFEQFDTATGGHKKVLICSNRGITLPRISSRVITQRLKDQKRNAQGDDRVHSKNTSIVRDGGIDDDIQELSGGICPDDIDRNNNSRIEKIQDISVDDEYVGATAENTLQLENVTDIEGTSSTENGNGMSMSQQDDSEIVSEIVQDTETNSRIVFPNTNSINEAKYELKLPDASSILAMFKSDKHCNNKSQWNNKTSQYVLEILHSADKLAACRDAELRIIIRYMKQAFRLKLKESENKRTKLTKLSHLIGLQVNFDNMKQQNKRKVSVVKKLSELASFAMGKAIRKSDLNIIYAEYLWPQEIENWQKNYPTQFAFPKLQEPTSTENEKHNEANIDCSAKSNAKTACVSNDNEDTCLKSQDLFQNNILASTSIYSEEDDLTIKEWFYRATFSKSRLQYEVSCIDSSHLLTRTRRKCCKGGLDGLSNKAWREVAKSNKTSLSLAMIDCIVEPMSVSVAVTHFSEEVEKEMRELGYVREADICRDIRMWWQAEDEPGISAKRRIQLRMRLRQRLLQHVTFSHFPPPTMYVKGWPIQLWEAIIANIDAKILLYYLSQKKTYNVRAFSSMLGETFFSELTLYDRRGQGTVTAQEFGHFINTSIEKLHMRLDAKRTFAYRTARKPVYKLVDKSEDKENLDVEDTLEDVIREHPFDNPGRDRLKTKRHDFIKTDRNAVQRGSLGVRWEKARRNESKLLPTFRLGIGLESLK